MPYLTSTRECHITYPVDGICYSSFGCQLLRRAGGDGVVEARRRSHAGVSSARDGAGGSRGAIAASCLGIVISSLLRAKSERVIFRSSGSGVGAELLDSSIDRGMIPQSRRAGDTRVFGVQLLLYKFVSPRINAWEA